MSPTATDETYAPRRMPWVKIALWIVPMVAIAWSFSSIIDASTRVQTVVVLSGVIVLLMIYWHQWRRWQTRHQMPAALRRNLSWALRSPLPYGSLRTIGHRFGTFFKPGAPKKIIIRAEGLTVVDEKMSHEMLRIAAEICGMPYVLDQRRSKQGKKVVLREKPKEKTVELTPREATHQRIVEAVRELYPKHSPQVACTWDEENQEEDYLLEVTISGIPGMELSLSGKRRQALQKLRTRLPQGNFHPSVDDRADMIFFRRSRPLPAMVVPPKHHAALMRSDGQYRRFSAPLGMGDDDQQATWTPARDAHLLVIGGTGGGKTIAEHGVIQRLTQAGWRTWLVDGKQIEFTGYRQWSNVEFLAQDVDSQIRVLRQAHETMMARYKLIREGRVKIKDLDPIAVVIDELTSLLEFIDQRYQETKVKGMPSRHPVLKWVGNLIRLGRSAKIHLVIGMQRPDTKIIDGEIRDNLGGRISLGQLKSKEGSMMMWDDPAIGVQVPAIKGRAISYINGVPGQVQSAYTANPDPAAPDYQPGMVEAARPSREIYGRKHIAEVEHQTDPEGREEEMITWHDLLDAQILDETDQPVVFDPVTSPESKALRRESAPAEAFGDINRLQTADSFNEAMDLFTFDPVEQLVEGKSLARQITRWIPTGNPQREELEEDFSEAMSQSYSTPLSEGVMTEVSAVEPGQYIHLEELGEDVMVSTCGPTEDEPATYTVTGYTAEGEAVSEELSAETAVETFDQMQTA